MKFNANYLLCQFRPAASSKWYQYCCRPFCSPWQNFAEIRRLSKKVSGSKIFRRDSSREKQGTRTISSLQSTDNQLTGVM